MTCVLWNLCIVGLVGLVLSTYVSADPLEKCQPRNSTYSVGDSDQCDKYYECGTAGKFTDRLCDDGFVFSLSIHQCDYPHNVNCTERPELQPLQSTNPKCPRLNGFYAFPAEESCQKFHHCLQGEAYEKTCPEGVIFDDTKGACVHPDMAFRAQCSATQVLDFKCPNAEKRFSKLRFGNHDRHAHLSDCRKFYVCMQDGQPRIGGCPIGKVFNAKTGNCDHPKRVPNCEDYYGKKGHPKVEGDDVAAEEDADQAAVETNENEANTEAPKTKKQDKLAKHQ